MFSTQTKTFVDKVLKIQIDSSNSFDIISPISSEKLIEIKDHNKAIATETLERSTKAFASWKQETAYTRSALLKKWHALIAAHETELAEIMTLEMGKPLKESEVKSTMVTAWLSGTPKKPNA